ncbi:TPA: host specificity factor TipJ family phage tail protein [Klebsiella michiganensis]
MTIRVFVSKLSEEPIEVYTHGTTSLHDWLCNNVTGYRENPEPRMTIEVDGELIQPDRWALCVIKPNAIVDIRPIPYGGVIGSIFKIVAAPLQYVFNLLGMGVDISTDGYNSIPSGNSLDLSPAKANTVKLGDPIREVFGRCRVYPDYVTQPVTRFDKDDPTVMRVDMLLCIGRGNFSFTNGDIRVGNTPISSLPGFDYTTYAPGEIVSGDARSENWYSASEVGGTSSGTGLDMAQTAPSSEDILADSLTVSGNTITFSGLDSDDNNDDDADDNKLPDSWAKGAIVEISAPANFVISEVGGYSLFTSKTLTELQPYVGMPVTLIYNGVDYDLFIATFTPSQNAVPGEGGNPAMIRSSGAPERYDFSEASATFTLIWRGEAYPISLVANYVNMSGVLAAISDGLSGSGLIAQDIGGVVVITEESSPFSGGSITSSSLPVAVFGSDPDYIVGSASSGGSPAVTANVRLAYSGSTGTPFTGMPEGVQRIALSHRGSEYQIVSTDGPAAVLSRIVNGVVDGSWAGFYPRTMIDYSASGINENEAWMGPFLACPANETIDAFEVNFSFPSGICGFDDRGNKRSRRVTWEIQYRLYGAGGEWISKTGSYSLANVNGLGFTERITLPQPALVEVRCRRRNEQNSNNDRDNMYWQALRGRLLTRPGSYAGVTLMGVTVETGGRLAAQSDRRVNVVVTRVYDSGAVRSISGALYHVLKSAGFKDNQIDRATIDDLEAKYWTPRGETFDFSASDGSSSVKDILDKITTAGMGYFLLSDGLASAGREGVKPWKGIISPQEQTKELQTLFSALSEDDYDGVDVTYINGQTWAEETVQCRYPDKPTATKIESFQLDGVLDQDRAYRIGMRRLWGYRYQGFSYSTATELDALCYQYMDRVVLTDDTPGTSISCRIIEMEYDSEIITLGVDEPLDWSVVNPGVIIRLQDGSASGLIFPTQIDDYTLTVPYSSVLNPESWIMDDADIEPLRLVFCHTENSVSHALITNIEPSTDDTCEVTAIQYDARKYQDDNSTYPGDVT